MSLAGRERRFPQQLRFKKAINPGWNPVNFVFLLGTLIILGTSSFVIVSYMLSSISSII